MRVGHLLCSGGADACALLGALVDAGASVEAVEGAVRTLGEGDVRLALGRVRRGGLSAVTVRVRAPQGTPPANRWSAVRGIIDGAGLAPAVRAPARAAFAALVAAAARTAGTEPDEHDLHPVRALDDLAGIVAVCAALDDLGLEEVTCGPVTVGTGLLDTAQGPRPVPDPVAAVLLRGFRCVEIPLAAELVTPAGAALLAELVRPDGMPPPLRLEACGVGAGNEALGAAGALRVLVGRRRRVSQQS